MIRFILEVAERDQWNGYEGKSMFTLDADVPGLESQLSRCGFSENGYLVVKLIGAEVLRAARAAGEGVES